MARTYIMWLLLLLLPGLAYSGGALDIGVDDEPTTLSVLFKNRINGLGRAEDIVETLPQRTFFAATLKDRLGNPKAARLMIPWRLDPEYRLMLGDTHPEELLQRYIVLEFDDAVAKIVARTRLKGDDEVVQVSDDQFADFAAVPSDPFYATSALGDVNWQWGINNRLSLQAAWNNVKGTAYVGHLDNGIRIGHPDLAQAWRPHFTFPNVTSGTDVDEHPEQGGYAGHGTHTAGIIAASTTLAGVPAGYPNPTPARGVAGVCWYCNLMVARISRYQAGRVKIFPAETPPAVNWAVKAGAQVLNMSFEGQDPNCAANTQHAYCLALKLADLPEVNVVAAAGNSNKWAALPVGMAASVENPNGGDALGTEVAFPARHANAIAVGAIQRVAGPAPRGDLWTEEPPQIGFYGSSTGTGMMQHGILAPGRDILSTLYDNTDWSPTGRCGVTAAQRGPRHGPCTGTSMATPHITGVVALMRSVDPLLGWSSIRQKLLAAGDNAATKNATRGYGVVNANSAVTAVLNQTNRLTPLFSLVEGSSYFYSVVPQQMRAAAGGTLHVANYVFRSEGNGITINTYTAYPDTVVVFPARPYPRPVADVWVFSTFKNPFGTTPELLPLYRLSWKCGDPGRTVSVCSSFPNRATHVYSTSLPETQTLITSGFKFDGIEGYVMPASMAKPAGAVELRRAYNPTWDSWALYDLAHESAMLGQGFNGAQTLGYAYPNLGSRPTY